MIICLLFSFNISSYAGFSDFIKSNGSQGSSYNKGKTKTHKFFGGSGSNSISAEQDLSKSSASIGIKADCNQIQLDFNFSALINDVMDDLSQVIKTYGQIKLVNTIIFSLAYLESAHQCKALLPKELGASFVTKELASRISKSIKEDLSDAFSTGRSAVGGSASFGERKTEVKPTKVAKAVTKASTEVQKQGGELFLACIDEHIPENEKKIVRYLNWSISLGFEKYFKLRQECMLKSEQAEMDIVQMLKQYKNTGEIVFADAVRIRDDGTIEMLAKRSSVPTITQDKNILKVSANDFVNWGISHDIDPLIINIIGGHILYIIKNFDNVSQMGIGNYIINMICYSLSSYTIDFSSTLKSLTEVNYKQYTVNEYLNTMYVAYKQLYDVLKSSTDNSDKVITFTADEVLQYILDSYRNYGSYRPIIVKSIMVYLASKGVVANEGDLTIDKINEILKSESNFIKYVAAGYLLYLIEKSGYEYGVYNLPDYMNANFYESVKKLASTYLALRKAVEAERMNNPSAEITLTKVTKLIQQNAISYTDLERDLEYKGLYGLINTKCKLLN
ncbi:hypothetical protein [Deferribacter desulfuricans]|nr:hypothetical protein [Deferribacter desulfuricans]